MSSAIKSLLIIGSTGSIGESTLDVVQRNPDRFKVTGLVAGQNIERLKQQCALFKPCFVVICNPVALSQWHELGFSQTLFNQVGHSPEVYGQESLNQLVQEDRIDCVMAAIVGSEGLASSLAALEAGKTVFLANKESLVLGGQFMLEAQKKSGAKLLPVDSEHNAIYQCLPNDFETNKSKISRLILTASGGPFRSRPLNTFHNITAQEAVAHPNWQMGKKISVDSATMANKGLELIEALWFFGLPAQQFSVLIHPQSIVHSLVEYSDSSVLAQLGSPDMRTPIAHVMGFPDRINSGSPKLKLEQIHKLTFEEPDLTRFPMLKLAYQVLDEVKVAAPIFNASNEMAVKFFLNNQLGYNSIHLIVQECLDKFSNHQINCIEEAYQLDQQVRAFVNNRVLKQAS